MRGIKGTRLHHYMMKRLQTPPGRLECPIVDRQIRILFYRYAQQLDTVSLGQIMQSREEVIAWLEDCVECEDLLTVFNEHQVMEFLLLRQD